MIRLLLISAIILATIKVKSQNKTINPSEYICPPCGGGICDSISYKKLGTCPHCNMILTKKESVKTIAFYLQDGVEILDFAGSMEVFAYAGYKVFTVSKNQKPIKSQGILTIVPDYSIKNAPKADILAFFGVIPQLPQKIKML